MFREKRERFLVTFPTTTQAMKMEEAARLGGLEGRLIPVPVQISAGCGMAWISPLEKREEVLACIRRAKVETEEIYEMRL